MPDPLLTERAVVALMIGELDYMSSLNPISRAIVAHAIEVWRQLPGSVLICESTPMRDEAVRRGVSADEVVVALPQPRGHTTRLVAMWMARSPYAARRAVLVTHEMHASRARRIFERAGVTAEAVPLALPFAASDPDWKLRSRAIFRLYNAVAYLYCGVRGWL